MSDGARGERYTPNLIVVGAGLLVLALLAFSAIGWGLLQEFKYRSEAESREHHYSRTAYAPARNACLVLSSQDKSDCISDADQKARENQRGEQDLVAQRITAVWTSIMGNAAVVGMFLSVVGVFLVFTTFNATREANLIARDADSAWVVFSIPSQPLAETQSGKVPIGFSNAGRTVAVITSVYTAYSKSGRYKDGGDWEDWGLWGAMHMPEAIPSEGISNYFWIPLNDDTKTHLVGWVDYKDIFRRKHRSYIRVRFDPRTRTFERCVDDSPGWPENY